MMLKKTIALVAAVTPGAHAFWRMECRGRLAVARIDPIVSFGAAASHAHVLHGSNGILPPHWLMLPLQPTAL